MLPNSIKFLNWHESQPIRNEHLFLSWQCKCIIFGSKKFNGVVWCGVDYDDDMENLHIKE